MKIFLSHNLNPQTAHAVLLARFQALCVDHGIELMLPKRGNKIAKGKIKKADMVIGLETGPADTNDAKWLKDELQYARKQEKPMLLIMDQVPEGCHWEGTWQLPLVPRSDRRGQLPAGWELAFPLLSGVVMLLLGLVELSQVTAHPTLDTPAPALAP